jgi:hypothetical protein
MKDAFSSPKTFPYSPPTVFVLALLALFAGGAVLSACDSDSGGDEDALTGTYSLVSLELEGEQVPPEDVSDGQLTLDDDGTWSGFFVLSDGEEEASFNGQGNYAVSDGSIRFFVEGTNLDDPELEDISQTTGQLNDGRLSIEMEKVGDDDGHSAVLEKD